MITLNTFGDLLIKELHTSDLLVDDLLDTDLDLDIDYSVTDYSLSTADEAFHSLPLVAQDALLQQSRLILVANNPSIEANKLAELLQSTDMLVLFNDFIHAEFFATHPIARALPKLLFFRQNGDSSLHFGLPPRSNKVVAIEQMCQQSSVAMLFSNIFYQYPAPADDPRPDDDPITSERILTIPSLLRGLLESTDSCRVLSEKHSVVADYPCIAGIHSSAPTSGFLLYRLLLSAREHVQHLQPHRLPLEIVMLGFNNDDKTAHFWDGHNWQYERQELATRPAGVNIIRQY